MNKQIAVGILTLALLSAAGCGSSSSMYAPPAPSNPTANRITRATESQFSDDARILAAADAAASGATWLSASAAARYDADLSAIRAAYPAVTNIHARTPYDLHTVLVSVAAGTPWIGKWQGGALLTGSPAVDALLAEFAPDTVAPLGGAGATYFTLHFPQSLNMPKLAAAFQTAGGGISAAQPDYALGDGNALAANATDGDGTRHYTFSVGFGDCAAGCINRHTYQFRVSADGKVVTLVSETGAALPARM